MALPLLALIPALAGYILTDWLHIPDTRLSIYGDALTILLWAVLFIPSISAAFRRLHDSNLSGKFILIPILIFIVTFLLIFLLRLVPEDMAPYLDYLGMVSSLMDLLSILFLSMMLLKSSPGPNEYGVLPQKMTVS